MIERFLRYGLTALLFCAICAPQQAGADDETKEYLVKAAFVYNFVKFVEWPADKAIARQSSIDICVIGDGPMEKTQAVFKAASTSALVLSLVAENNSKNVSSHCHILFIGAAETSRAAEILSALKGAPVLTVSDIDNFAERGGMIGFVKHDNKVKIVVNKKSVASAGMRVDAQLLEIAMKVIDK